LLSKLLDGPSVLPPVSSRAGKNGPLRAAALAFGARWARPSEKVSLPKDVSNGPFLPKTSAHDKAPTLDPEESMPQNKVHRASGRSSSGAGLGQARSVLGEFGALPSQGRSHQKIEQHDAENPEAALEKSPDEPTCPLSAPLKGRNWRVLSHKTPAAPVQKSRQALLFFQRRPFFGECFARRRRGPGGEPCSGPLHGRSARALEAGARGGRSRWAQRNALFEPSRRALSLCARHRQSLPFDGLDPTASSRNAPLETRAKGMLDSMFFLLGGHAVRARRGLEV